MFQDINLKIGHFFKKIDVNIKTPTLIFSVSDVTKAAGKTIHQVVEGEAKTN